jgi:hypothetical protein
MQWFMDMKNNFTNWFRDLKLWFSGTVLDKEILIKEDPIKLQDWKPASYLDEPEDVGISFADVLTKKVVKRSKLKKLPKKLKKAKRIKKK